MKCMVPGCNNDSRCMSTSEGISFHPIPVEPSLRTAWLKAINIDPLMPQQNGSAVCSKHFHNNDEYLSKKMQSTLRSGAIPFCQIKLPPRPVFLLCGGSTPIDGKANRVQMPYVYKPEAPMALTTATINPTVTTTVISSSVVVSSTTDTVSIASMVQRSSGVTCDMLQTQESETGDNRKPKIVRVCRICLLMDTKLLSMKSCDLETAYSQLTGLPLEDSLPQEVCWECAQLVRNSARLRARAVKAHALLTSLLEREGHLSIESLRGIDRESNRLSSNLNVNHFDNDHTDLNIICKDDGPQTDTNDKVIAEVKEESDNKIFMLEENSNFYREDGNTDNEMDTDDTDIAGSVDNNQFNKARMVRHNKLKKQINKLTTADNDYISDDSLTNKKTARKVPQRAKAKKSQVKAERKVRKQIARKPKEPKVDKRTKSFALFTIKWLTADEQVAELQKRAESDHYKNAVYKCTECYHGFIEEDSYKSHMVKHTNECGEYVCDTCKSHFPNPTALKKHKTSTHSRKYACTVCPFVTTHQITARLHERWHVGTRYKCEVCGEVFNKFTTYRSHIRIRHPSDIVCGLCGYSFFSNKGLDQHKKLKHRIEDQQVPADGPQCAECDVRFASAQALRNHLGVSARHATAKEKRQTNSITYRLNRLLKAARESGDNFDGEGSRTLLSGGTRGGRGARGGWRADLPVACEQCGVQCANSRAYHSHFRRAHPDKNRTSYPSMRYPLMCEQCGKILPNVTLLRCHKLQHVDEKPLKCDQCGKGFASKPGLVAHIREHTGGKATYVCAACGKGFSTPGNRQRHMSTHTGLKPFKCETCGKHFSSFDAMRAHVKYVHLKKPWPKRSRGKRRQSAQAAGASETDVDPPAWPACERRESDAHASDDKPVCVYSDNGDSV